MSASLKELSSKNIQDKFYTENSQVTFFKSSRSNHTNFAEETVNINFKEMTFGSSDTIDISRQSADLVRSMFVRIKIDSIDPVGNNFAWVKKLGHAIIDRVSITCGSSTYDTHYGTWLDIWNELTCPKSKKKSYSKMIGDIEELTNYNSNKKPSYVLMIPLIFWFNNNPGSSFPLISSRLSTFSITLRLSEKEKLFIRDDYFDEDKVSISEVSLITKFVYLDDDERKLLISKPQEYLIDKLEFNGVEKMDSEKKNYLLSLIRPTREIIWCMKNSNYTTGQKFIYYSNKLDWKEKSDSGFTPLQEASIKILRESISTSELPTSGTWIELLNNQSYLIGSVSITNSFGSSIWYNEHSIGYKSGNSNIYLNDKISANIIVTSSGISLENIETNITVYDLSIPVKYMIDTRYNEIDPKVYQFDNYGVLIDGNINPFIDCGLKYGGISRVDVQSIDYFSDVQQYNKHTNIAKTGICSYSFSLNPELLQPTGTDMINPSIPVVLSLTAKKYPELNFINNFNEFWSFSRSIALIRFIGGRSAIK